MRHYKILKLILSLTPNHLHHLRKFRRKDKIVSRERQKYKFRFFAFIDGCYGSLWDEGWAEIQFPKAGPKISHFYHKTVILQISFLRQCYIKGSNKIMSLAYIEDDQGKWFRLLPGMLQYHLRHYPNPPIFPTLAAAQVV